jgi:protein-tyrosine-phosphatase
MLRLAKARGLDLSAHRSRQLEALELSDYTLALAMSEDDFWHLKALAKEKYCKIRINLYQEYSGQLGLREVPDPLLGEISFEAAYLVLEQTAKKLVRPIRELSLNANWQK